MADSSDAEYPPPTNTWQFPPPRVPRRWGVVAIAGAVSAAAVTAAAVGWLSATQSRDAVGFFDEDEVISAVDISCALMVAEVSRIPVSGTSLERAEAVSQQNQVVESMVQGIRRVDPETRAADRPLDAWLADWETLVRVRETWAQQVADGADPTLTIPTDEDGDPITERMDAAAGGLCAVPETITDPGSGEDLDV